MTDNAGRRGRPWERIKNLIKQEATHCMKCGKPINAIYKWPHPNSVTIGHIIPLALGGKPLDMNNLQPECIKCNSGEGNAIHNRLQTKHTNWINDKW